MNRFESGHSAHGRGDDDIISPGSREERQRSSIDADVYASKEVGMQYDHLNEEEELMRQAISSDDGWQSIDHVIESRFNELDQNILSSSRELLAILGFADAGSISFYHELRQLEPFITREPQLLERLVKEVNLANQAIGREIVTIDDVGLLIRQRGIEEIEFDQTSEDVSMLQDLGIDRVELQRRLNIGTFQEKKEIRSLARLLREGPMQKFVKVISYQAQEMGEVDFNEVLIRARGVIKRHNRQEAELAAGEERAVKKWEDKLSQIETKRTIMRELQGYLSELRTRNMLKGEEPTEG